MLAAMKSNMDNGFVIPAKAGISLPLRSPGREAGFQLSLE
jgi:hypothetical protein